MRKRVITFLLAGMMALGAVTCAYGAVNPETYYGPNGKVVGLRMGMYAYILKNTAKIVKETPARLFIRVEQRYVTFSHPATGKEFSKPIEHKRIVYYARQYSDPWYVYYVRDDNAPSWRKMDLRNRSMSIDSANRAFIASWQIVTKTRYPVGANYENE